MGAGTSQSLLLLFRYLFEPFRISVVSDKHSDELPRVLSGIDIPHYGLHDRTIIYLPHLIWLIVHNKIDLVYGNNFSGRSRVAVWASKITGRPFVWHIRESINEKTKFRDFIQFASTVIANSQNTANRLIEYANVKEPIVIPNGVELSDFLIDKSICRNQLINLLGCDKNSVFVINLGRICEQKNQLAVVQVAKRIVVNNSKVHYIFLGDYQDLYYVENLKKEIHSTIMGDQFHIFDHTRNFIPILLGCDVLLHTAKLESQGRVILEAMAAQIPVVAYNVGGVGESVVQGETGFLRSWNDVEGLAADLTLLLNDQALRLKFGQAGYGRVKQRYSAEITAMKVKSVIEQELSKFNVKH